MDPRERTLMGRLLCLISTRIKERRLGISVVGKLESVLVFRVGKPDFKDFCKSDSISSRESRDPVFSEVLEVRGKPKRLLTESCRIASEGKGGGAFSESAEAHPPPPNNKSKQPLRARKGVDDLRIFNDLFTQSNYTSPGVRPNKTFTNSKTITHLELR